ncbi:MAG: ATP synthase F1 subunit delta [Planctomycetes bacterium]|nr:ATP synthase F1 subunit delta [Planctomycetota bacterium]
MPADAVARVYAKSLYELAEEAGGRSKILQVASELEGICELARNNKSFGEFLGSPIIDRARRAASLRRICHEKVTDLSLRFLLVLNEKERLKHLELISEAYDQLVDTALGRIEVDVYTATPIDEEQLDSIKNRISTALGKEAILYSYVDQEMIGGLKLFIGDQLIDGSVASRLRRMNKQLRVRGADLAGRIGRIIEEGGET